jgi:membrane protease YdiL (CAAX protease family)
VVGIGLAVVYQKRQSLLASMAAHGTFNVIGFAFLLLSRR